MKASSNGGALKAAHLRIRSLLTTLSWVNLRRQWMTMIHWVLDVDLEELAVPLQCWYDSIARKDAIDRKASKVQFNSGVRGNHGSGKGYDLQRSEVTNPLRRRRGSVPSKGVTLPQSAPFVP